MATNRLVPRATQPEMGKQAIPFLDVWIGFNFASGLVLLPILVLTFLLSNRVIKRHPSLINVCMTWILSGFFSLLLFFGGRSKPRDPEPSKALCIAQTSLLYGILPMWSVAVFILMYFILGVVNADGRSLRVGRGKMLMMLGAPYFAQFCFSVATLIVSLKNPSKVTREDKALYCALQFHPLSNAMYIFTFIVCLGIIMLEIQLGLLLYRNWRGLRRAGQSTPFDVQLVVRVIVFGGFVFLGMFVDIISMFSQRSVVPDMYAATAGTVVFLVFGSQADVLRAWCFWKRDGPVHVSPPESVGWMNIDLNSDSRTTTTSIIIGHGEKWGGSRRSMAGLTENRNDRNDNREGWSDPLRSPIPAQIADHVHGLHGTRDPAVAGVQGEGEGVSSR
ncbi:hypothetical protein D9757_005505 [Collybiopsis confluens]|uniref:Uncharacterized protein n=1 Tax=Collybiopsis confluens TaxID=2823264 RepID=A0A8H5HLW8_9AGAR|nr:hypothetical protein D9757_005505 [Collybiopsis confluens]